MLLCLLYTLSICSRDRLESSLEFIFTVILPTLMKYMFMISATEFGSVISVSFSVRQMSESSLIFPNRYDFSFFQNDFEYKIPF